MYISSACDVVIEITRRCNMCCAHCLRGDAESIPCVQDVCDVTEDESKEYEDGGYGIYGNHGSCYARILQIETIVED